MAEPQSSQTFQSDPYATSEHKGARSLFDITFDITKDAISKSTNGFEIYSSFNWKLQKHLLSTIIKERDESVAEADKLWKENKALSAKRGFKMRSGCRGRIVHGPYYGRQYGSYDLPANYTNLPPHNTPSTSLSSTNEAWFDGIGEADQTNESD